MPKPVILIVEDEGIVALDLKIRIGRMGFTPIQALTGKDALKIAEDTDIDLILLDIRLRGDLDGIEIATRIQDTNPTPIIYLSALIDKSTKERANKTNPAAYIEKPFSDEILHNAIYNALNTA